MSKAKPLLLNPVRRKVYAYKTDNNSEFFNSGESALSRKSILAPPRVDVYGTMKTQKCATMLQMIDSETQCELELWRYDPTKLSDDNCVDALSLAIALENIRDERVELSVEEMLSEIWKVEK